MRSIYSSFMKFEIVIQLVFQVNVNSSYCGQSFLTRHLIGFLWVNGRGLGLKICLTNISGQVKVKHNSSQLVPRTPQMDIIDWGRNDMSYYIKYILSHEFQPIHKLVLVKVIFLWNSLVKVLKIVLERKCR